VASGSAAKKVARLAQKGKGTKVRFQGGTVFPMTMAVIIALGLGLVVYARQSAPSTNTPPTINDHWHVSYGFYACDQQLKDLVGNKEEPPDPNYVKYGVHSHEDGVIHWHPQALATGRRAKMGIFLETYGVKVNTEELTFPPDQNDGKSYKVGTDKCKDEDGKEVDGQVSAVVWERYDDPASKKTFITDFDNIRIDKDGMAVMFVFAAPGIDIPMPASASNLPELGAADTGGATTTTVAGATTTTVEGATTTSVAATTTTAG
jgi:hypothetical protein